MGSCGIAFAGRLFRRPRAAASVRNSSAAIRELCTKPFPPQSFVVPTGRQFKHRKRADLGNVFRLFDDCALGADFHVGEAKGRRANATRSD
jgi:hypothetical protein